MSISVSHPPSPETRPQLRLLYAAGPGDVIRTYQHWKTGHHDPTEVATAYSTQFFDTCRNLGASALVISSHPRREILHDDSFTIEHRPRPDRTKRGLHYHLAQLSYLAGLCISALRFRADAVIAADFDHWWAFTPLRWLGIKVVPSLHCAFWPPGRRNQSGLLQRATHALNGLLWRQAADATLCISPECQRQLLELTASAPPHTLVGLCHYRRGTLDRIAPAPTHRHPFRIMFAGRIEREKGVFDLLEVASLLEQQSPGRFIFELCGSGGASEPLAEAARERGLQNTFLLPGRLNLDQMVDAYRRCHAVVVPTKSDAGFAEGINKVAVESVLAGRPVVTSKMCPAIELVGDAVLEVPPDDVPAYAYALARLANDPNLYDRLRSACARVAEPFYSTPQSWGATLDRALRELTGVPQAPLPTTVAPVQRAVA